MKLFSVAVYRGRDGGEDLGEFVLLNQTQCDLSTAVTVLGCSLFSHILPTEDEAISDRLNGFYLVKGWTTSLHQQAHEYDLNWLNSQGLGFRTHSIQLQF